MLTNTELNVKAYMTSSAISVLESALWLQYGRGTSWRQRGNYGPLWIYLGPGRRRGGVPLRAERAAELTGPGDTLDVGAVREAGMVKLRGGT